MNVSSVETAGGVANIYNNPVVKYYNFLIHELSDPRTHDFFLISSPFLPGGILLAYLYFTLSWGPKYMEHRKPYELKKVLVLYNFIQVCLSSWIFWEGLDSAWLRDYSWRCEPMVISYSPNAYRVVRAVYIYFLCKMSELLDTVFFVLRKKNNQITFLHMYHHTGMVLISWGATKYYPGGHTTFIGLINSFVHIIMYGYYLLSALVPQKYLWWKKYITTLQLTQFGIAILHSSQLIFYDCNFPKWTLLIIIPNTIFFIILFLDFYKAAYTSSEKKSATGETQSLQETSEAKSKAD